MKASVLNSMMVSLALAFALEAGYVAADDSSYTVEPGNQATTYKNQEGQKPAPKQQPQIRPENKQEREKREGAIESPSDYYRKQEHPDYPHAPENEPPRTEDAE